jgi:hypothetical protein
MDDVIIMAVLQSQQYLSHIVTADGLGVDEASRGPLDNLETEVGAGHKFENHVEHALGAVSLQKLHYVRMFQHVTYGGLPFEVVEAEARAGGKLGHVDNLDRKLLARLPMNTSSDQGKRTFSYDLMQLVDVVKENFITVRHDGGSRDRHDGPFAEYYE